MSDQPKTETPAETFKRFVTGINGHDVQALSALMASNHLFVDSLGNRVEGAARMQAGWRSYFAMSPGYSLQIDDVMSHRATVLAVGQAGGTIDDIPWRTPAAWKAVIHDGKVLEFECLRTTSPFTRSWRGGRRKFACRLRFVYRGDLVTMKTASERI